MNHRGGSPDPRSEAIGGTGFLAAVLADHRFMVETRLKYSDRGARRWALPVDVITKIGFQMMVAVRVMQFFRNHRLTPLAAVASRLIRHLYGAEIHWGAAIAPAVRIVHGTGLVIGRQATVGPRCILFQGVTLGDSLGRDGVAGAPTLEGDVHVGVNAVLVGPIRIGSHSKVMANTFVDVDVPPFSLVATSPARVVPRDVQRNRSEGERA